MKELIKKIARMIEKELRYTSGWKISEEEYSAKCLLLAGKIISQIQIPAVQKKEFIPIVAHVVIKNEEANNKLERILTGNDLYIDYTQTLTSYKAKRKELNNKEF